MPTHHFGACMSTRLGGWTQLLLACAAWWLTPARAAATCDGPVVAGALAMHGTGEATALSWAAQQNARKFRVWSQWRVPEGEAIRTYEVVVDGASASLPPSPAPWRPLKLSVEIQSLCNDGTVSPTTHLHQLQFDGRAEAACPPVDGLRLDPTVMRVTWKGGPQDRTILSFHATDDGRLLAQQDAVGSAADWPPSVQLPAVIQVVRACGEAQRSRVTFQLVP